MVLSLALRVISRARIYAAMSPPLLGLHEPALQMGKDFLEPRKHFFPHRFNWSDRWRLVGWLRRQLLNVFSNCFLVTIFLYMYCIFLCFYYWSIIVLYLEFYYTYNISLKMSSWFKRAVTTVADVFGLFSSDLLQPPIKYTKTQENSDDATIQIVANTVAEKNANKAKLNRALTNYLNDGRNSIPFESVDVPVVPAVLPKDLTPAVAMATIDETSYNLILDNALNTKESSGAVSADSAANLQRENKLFIDSMQAFIAAQTNITIFRLQSINEAVIQFRDALLAYNIPVTPEMLSYMEQIAKSWSEFLISSTTPDSSIYLSVKTFFFRVNQAIDALLTQCIFLSDNWKARQKALPQPELFLTSIISTSTTGNINISYPIVKVRPCCYVVGPILDFQNIEGRIFIYVKCYHTEERTGGIYFWVYRSQSEGWYRVFFKLDPFGSIEKGFDYTQGTLVHFRLQMELCEYYEIHYRQGIRNPIKIDSLTRLNYFMSQMPYLQASNFLDKFPGAIIEPSFYSRVSTGIEVVKCAKGENKDDCCYVCLTKSYVKPVVLTPSLTQSPGMIGHYYIIDDIFGFIIKKGFPIHQPIMDSDWSKIVNMLCKKRRVDYETNKFAIAKKVLEEWQTQRDTYFPENEGDPVNPNYRLNYEFSRRRMRYVTTCPYIFCFTTCGLVQSCPIFKLFLSANSYKTTFWCQGFQNYTEMLSIPSNREILSPVLYVVIGALLRNSDMALSTLRNIILNIGINTSNFNKATRAIMTLGTRPNFQEPDSTIIMDILTTIRQAAKDAYQKIQSLPKIESLDLPLKYGSHRVKYDANLDTIIKENVNNKIKMIECLAFIYFNTATSDPTNPFVAEVKRLLTFHPEPELKLILPERIKLAAINTQVPKDAPAYAERALAYAAKQTEANAFIVASPEAAAAALFGYISSQKRENEPTEFEKDLTDFANLCLKKNWIGGMMDDAYRALEGVFNPENAIYNYLDINGLLHEFDPAAATPLVPTPYVFISSFDEVRKEDTSPTNPDPKELNVTVVTFAHIYRVDCGYHDMGLGKDELKSMSIIYQISTTIVYTREDPSRILYAMNQRTPLACLPDLPEALDRLRPIFIKETHPAAVQGTEELLTSPYNLCATYDRVTSYGALFAGKMMEYFFGGDNGYYQLPYFFKNFDKFLKVCHQYDSTALMYLPEISPYNLLKPLTGAENPLLDLSYFTNLGITFQVGSSIETKLTKNKKDIQAISDFLTGYYAIDSSVDDAKTDTSGSSSPPKSFSDSLSRSGSLSPDRISYFLLHERLESSVSVEKDRPYIDPADRELQRGMEIQTDKEGKEGKERKEGERVRERSRSIGLHQSREGGALSIKKHNPTYKKKTSKPNKKSRKYINSKRLMKSKVTKPKTYKRRATGGKRKSKPNKTMRRYRRVRK